jgi:hypothetical protein
MRIPRWLRRRKERTLVDTSTERPVIYTQTPDGGMGKVAEWARRQAAENIRTDPEKKRIAIQMLGKAEAMRRYPEGGWDD